MHNFLTLLLVLIAGFAQVVHIQADCLFEKCTCENFSPRIYVECKQTTSLVRLPPTDNDLKELFLIDASRLGLKHIQSGQLQGIDINLLDLTGNNLTEVSAGIFAGATIKGLTLDDNQIRTITPDAFTKLDLLELHLSGNRLFQMDTDALSHVFNTLINLSSLALARNKLTAIPDLSHMFKLKRITLSHNELTELMQSNPDKYLLPDNINTLELNNNQINHIDNRLFKNLKHLKYVNLNYNKITHIDANTFEDLVDLHTLTLAGNYISKLPAGAFLAQKYLKNLDLSSQNVMLRSIANYAFERNEENERPLELDLSKNRIEQLPSKAFCTHNEERPYAAIKNLDLTGNAIKALNPCVLRQIAQGIDDLYGTKQHFRPTVQINHNSAYIQYNQVKCDCNVTYAAQFVELRGQCLESDSTANALNTYQCNFMKSLGNIKKDALEMCQNLPQYNCELADEEEADTLIEPTQVQYEFTNPTAVELNSKTDQPASQINNVQNTHTSSNHHQDNISKNDRINKVTKQPSQIVDPNAASVTIKVSTLTVVLSVFATCSLHILRL